MISLLKSVLGRILSFVRGFKHRPSGEIDHISLLQALRRKK